MCTCNWAILGYNRFPERQLFTKIFKESNYITGCGNVKGLYAMYK